MFIKAKISHDRKKWKSPTNFFLNREHIKKSNETKFVS